jgi:hypothetical protein
MDFDKWIELFIKNAKTQIREITGSYRKLLDQQKNIEKIHRTRVDEKWKSFRRN